MTEQPTWIQEVVQEFVRWMGSKEGTRIWLPNMGDPKSYEQLRYAARELSYAAEPLIAAGQSVDGCIVPNLGCTTDPAGDLLLMNRACLSGPVMVIVPTRSAYCVKGGELFNFNCWARLLYILWLAGFDLETGAYRRCGRHRVAIVRVYHGKFDRTEEFAPPGVLVTTMEMDGETVYEDQQPECWEHNWGTTCR